MDLVASSRMLSALPFFGRRAGECTGECDTATGSAELALVRGASSVSRGRDRSERAVCDHSLWEGKKSRREGEAETDSALLAADKGGKSGPGARMDAVRVAVSLRTVARNNSCFKANLSTAGQDQNGTDQLFAPKN